MQIKIGKVPGRTQVIELQNGATIADAVREAGLDVSGHELRFNGVTVEDFNKTVVDGAIVLLTPRIKGNSEFITVVFEGEEFAMGNESNVDDLVDTALDESDRLEWNEVIARKINNRWYEQPMSAKLVAYGEYAVIDIDDADLVRETLSSAPSVIVPNTRQEISRVITGDIEIIVNRIL